MLALCWVNWPSFLLCNGRGQSFLLYGLLKVTSPLIKLYSAQLCQFTFIHLSKNEQTCSFSHSSHGQTADESGTYLHFRNVFLTSFKPQGCSEDEWRYQQCSDYDACKNERSICLDGQGRPRALLGCRQDHENQVKKLSEY